MKFSKITLLLTLALMMFLLQACPESTSPNGDDTGGSGKVQLIDSQTGGALKLDDGAEIIVPSGSIAQTDEGGSGKVSFSIEPGINKSDLPKPIPAIYKIVGKIYDFGPANFTFANPLQIYLPAASEESPAGLSIAWYNDERQEWSLLPINDIDVDTKRLGVTVFELGYFVIVRTEESEISNAGEVQSNKRVGGIKLTDYSKQYYYTIDIKNVVYKYPEIGWPNLVGYNTSTGSEPTGGPLAYTSMYNIPQGKYTLEISRVKRGTLMELPGQTETYTQLVEVSVTGFTSLGGWDVHSWVGWNEISVGSTGWRQGRPDDWPTPTVPFGTGEFQATLSWLNTYSSITDLDLHLVGPNGIHVYFAENLSPDGSIRLDRDWMDNIGNAVENIYSTKAMPKGQYKVYVDVYDGTVPKPFEVRIIRKGSIVKTHRAVATKVNPDLNISGSMLILTFNVD